MELFYVLFALWFGVMLSAFFMGPGSRFESVQFKLLWLVLFFGLGAVNIYVLEGSKGLLKLLLVMVGAVSLPFITNKVRKAYKARRPINGDDEQTNSSA